MECFSGSLVGARDHLERVGSHQNVARACVIDSRIISAAAHRALKRNSKLLTPTGISADETVKDLTISASGLKPISAKPNTGMRIRRAVAWPIYLISLILDYASTALNRLAAWIAGDDWPG
jgi:hypothetical protein